MTQTRNGTTRGGSDPGVGPNPIGEDSAGFIESFTAAVRPHEVRSRPLRWMLMVAFAIVFAAALGSLLNGVFGSGGGSAAASATTAPTSLLGATAPATIPLSGLGVLSTAGTATAAAPTSFMAVAGPACDGTGATFTESGFSLDAAKPTTQWEVRSTGGYKGASCSGGYVAMPVSGEASAVDTNRFALWSFTLGPGLSTKASCKLEVYVPNSVDHGLVGGAPADYYYYDAVYTSQTSPKPLGGFAVYQTTDRGRWLVAKTFSVTTGVVSLRLIDAGAEPAGAAGVVRDAAAQVRLTCSAS